MIHFKWAEAVNFMPYGQQPVFINLDRDETCLIVGNNEDIGDQGLSKNGVGKTSIMQMIVFALFGKGIESKMKADEMVNLTNKKKMKVKLAFYKNNKEYLIIRGRKPGFLEFYEDGVSLTRDSMANTQSLIEQVLEYNYEVFKCIYFLNPYKDSLLAMSAPEQKNIIETVLSISLLAERADALKKIKDDYNVDLKLINRDIDNAEQVNAKTQEALDRLQSKKKQFDEENSQQIKNLEELKQQLENIDFDYLNDLIKKKDDVEERISTYQSEKQEVVDFKHEKEKEISQKQSERKDYEHYYEKLKEAQDNHEDYDQKIKRKKDGLQKQLNQFPSRDELDTQYALWEKYDNVKEEIQSYEDKILELKREIGQEENDLQNQKDKLNKVLEGVCYTCGQEWHDDKEKENLENSIKEIKQKITNHKEQKTSCKNTINDLSEKREDILSRVDYGREDLEEYINEISKLENQLENFDDSNPYEETIQAYEEEGISLDDLKKAIDGCTQEIDSIEDIVRNENKRLKEIEKNIEHSNETLNEYNNELTSNNVYTNQDIVNLKEKIEETENEINNLKQQENPYQEEIEETKKNFQDVEELQGKKEDHEKQIKHIDYLRKLLTDSKSFVRKRLVDQYIPYVNKKINEYVELFSSPHVVEINPDMSVDLLYMNKNVSYYNLSRGERLRVDVATAMAFQDLMAMLGKNNNILMVDELFDSSADPGLINRMYKFLKERAKTVFVVSHREDFTENLDTKITVTKKNGFATIEESKIE